MGFIVEQALGHITHGKNLQRNVALDPTVEAFWGFPSWESSGMAGLVPNWTVKAGLQARRAIAAMQRKTQLDALFFHTQVTAALSHKWLKQFPSVISLDATPQQYDLLGEFYAHEPGPQWLEDWKWRINRISFDQARRLVAWSEWARQGLIGDYDVPPEKISVIPPGVNPDEWRLPAARNQEGAVKILFVGGDLERKGGLVLLDAFRLLRAQYQQAGAATSLPELHLVTRDQIKPEPGVIVYNDMQPNSAALKQLFYESHIFCLPSYGDCLPLALAEAGASELPLVSTSVAAIPEIVQEGETGFLIEPGDTEALTAILDRLIIYPELRVRLGANAADLVRREHDARHNTQKLLDLLKEVSDRNVYCS